MSKLNKFINRTNELKFLNKKYNSKNAELIILYGRRRIGKTELVLKFCEKKDCLYFMGRLESRESTIKRLNNLLIENFHDSEILNRPLSTFDEIFDYLNKKSEKKLLFVIDEFPFLVEKFPEVISILQEKWDSKLKNSKIKLILLGSSVSMMEKYALDYKSPLYGRRTGQWKVQKFENKYLSSFFPDYKFEDLIRVYSCIDSIPGYLNILDPKQNFYHNLNEKMFSKGEFLYEEIEILLREELRDPSNYMSIISAIAGGITNFNNIYQKTSLDKSLLSKYLHILESLNIVRRENPVGETFKSKLKSKKSLYFLSDNFFDFWFRFVYSNKQEIERGTFKIDKEDLERYISFKFEKYCMEFVQNSKKFDYSEVGRWWDNSNEIDIVGLSKTEKQVLFGECKWKNNVDAQKLLKDLFNKKENFKINNESRKEIFVIFAKSFKKKIKEFKGQEVICFDLKDLQKNLK
ncbi:MAG: ATP-binding protein [Nanoarchaeota archaeon]